MFHLSIAAFLAYLCFVQVEGSGVGYKVTEATSYTEVGNSGNSTLYIAQLADPEFDYDWPVYVLDLHGSRFQMGYDYGVLWGAKIAPMYWAFLEKIIGDSYEDQFVEEVLGPALDWQWEGWLSVELPEEFIEEIAGMKAGGHVVGVPDLDVLVSRIIVLANAPGDTQDWIYVLVREFNQWLNGGGSVSKSRSQTEEIEGLQCSMFGVWGSRTIDGSIYTARNLDWNKDTGIAQYKLITVFHPNDGKYAHATCGFAGLIGALAGMSSQGLTVHEATLEENEITFEGFPWIMRLRYIMENAKNLEEAQTLWEKTNNTVGFNHMIGSGSDAQSMVMETMRGYNAFFRADDPREANATMNINGDIVRIGYAMKEALYRTNHGYDPTIRKHYEWNYTPSSWTMERYMFLYNGFTYYEDADIKMDAYDAINMTSILGDKGHHAYQCYNNTDGTNVLSVTFHPAGNEMWVAWENGHNVTWRPASCNTYVHFNMSYWW